VLGRSAMLASSGSGEITAAAGKDEASSLMMTAGAGRPATADALPAREPFVIDLTDTRCPQLVLKLISLSPVSVYMRTA